MSGSVEQRLRDLGLALPDVATPQANYVPFTIAGGLVFIAGQLPLSGGSLTTRGKVGADVDLDAAYQAARLCGLNLIAVLRQAVGGDLGRVKRCAKVTGFVNAVPDFADHAKVINGASDLMVAAFGEAGKHARSSIGVGSLPLGAAVEVEAIFEIG